MLFGSSQDAARVTRAAIENARRVLTLLSRREAIKHATKETAAALLSLQMHTHC